MDVVDFNKNAIRRKEHFFFRNEIPTSDRNGLSVDEDEIVQYKIDLEEEWKPGPGGPVGNGDQQETHRTKYPD
ncbi:hypothetical protein JTB14_020815 [Gonioctena quinquepunctata]|nr:hypothetical protein JTB14_020815 [Gonioctena quinquepunctata]